MSLRDSVRSIVEAILGPRLDLLTLYPARVVSQGADGRLDLVPEDARIAPCSGVPLRYGAPGLAATVPAGGRVLLGYEHGDPGRPYAALWESGAVTALSVNGGSEKAAREGHSVNAGSISIIASVALGPTSFQVQYTTAAGVPVGTPQTVVLGVAGTVTLPMTGGRISEGADALRLP